MGKQGRTHRASCLRRVAKVLQNRNSTSRFSFSFDAKFFSGSRFLNNSDEYLKRIL
jgi:hypothetical protein